MVSDDVLDKYEVTIGIECHVQLATNTKLFSGADNDERDKSPNSVVSPIDFGLPGMLPVLNRRAVDLAIMAGKALGSPIAHISRFDRKHYFYPDLPKGYQTTQMYNPIIGTGIVSVPMENGESFDVRINHAHMEEDAGKLTHHGDFSLVDLNRAGTPLIEIVTEPDIHSSVQAKAFASELYLLMTYAGVTRGDLYHGNMRFDVNISTAPKGSGKLGTRSEVKNLNSLRSVERASEYEFRRQVELLEKGGEVVQETRGWDESKQKTSSQRNKEDSQDYRYMPDADIPPIILNDDEIKQIQGMVPTLPGEWRLMLSSLGLDFLQIDTLLLAENEFKGRVSFLGLVKSMIDEGDTEKAKYITINWFLNLYIPLLRDGTLRLGSLNSLNLETSVYELVMRNKLSSNNARLIICELAGENLTLNIEEYAKEKGYIQVSDESEISAIVDEVLADEASKRAINDFKNGNEKVIGFLVGQVMRKSGGKANPALAQKLIRQKLNIN